MNKCPFCENPSMSFGDFCGKNLMGDLNTAQALWQKHAYHNAAPKPEDRTVVNVVTGLRCEKVLCAGHRYPNEVCQFSATEKENKKDYRDEILVAEKDKKNQEYQDFLMRQAAPQKENKWEEEFWDLWINNVGMNGAKRILTLIHSLIREAEARGYNKGCEEQSQHERLILATEVAKARTAVLKEIEGAVETLQRFNTQQVSFAAYEKAKEDFKALLKEKSQQ